MGANLFSQFLGPPKSVADYSADLDRRDLLQLQLQGQQGQNQLQALTRQQQMDASRQSMADQQALRAAASQAGGDENALIQLLRQSGRPALMDRSSAIEKSALERGKVTAETAKTKAETKEKGSKLTDETIKRYRMALDFIDNPQAAAKWTQALYADPEAGPLMQSISPIEQAMAGIPQDPQQFEQWRMRATMGTEKLKEFEAKLDNEKATRAVTVRGQDLIDSRVKSEGAANRGVTIRGQDMTDARQRDLNETTKTDKAALKKEETVNKEVTKFAGALQKDGIPEIESALQGAEGVFQRYTKDGKIKDMPGIGAVTNALPDWAVTSEGKDVRESLSAVANIVLSARSGAAVTDQELRRLARELSNSIGASPDDTKRAYEKFRARFEKVKANLSAGVSDDVKQTYEDRGGIKITRGGEAPKDVSKTGLPSMSDIDAEIERRKKK